MKEHQITGNSVMQSVNNVTLFKSYVTFETKNHFIFLS